MGEDNRTVDEQVAEFHVLMQIPDRKTPGPIDAATLRLRMRLVIEEAFELVEACVDYSDGQDVVGYKVRVLSLISRAVLVPQLPKIADALGDIDYVVAGTRLQLGIQGKPIADAIHYANMRKVGPEGVMRDEHGKVTKPKDWLPPDIAKVLRAQGWEP
jgi:predicted HAD superfamily Cof-like phosphohydrolase